MCASCRSAADRSAEVTARFASSRATSAWSRLRPPLRGLMLCSCTERVMCASCLQTRAAEAAEGLRVADDYLDGCATNGHHHDPDELFDCIHASATIADSILAPTFCEHGRSAENCIVHARPAPGPRCRLRWRAASPAAVGTARVEGSGARIRARKPTRSKRRAIRQSVTKTSLRRPKPGYQPLRAKVAQKRLVSH